MNTTHPPAVVETIVSALLPPSRREQVLGDLKERCIDKQSYPTAYYILDALTTIPHIWWTTTRRSLFEPPLKLAVASDAAIRERTEQITAQRRHRHLAFTFIFFSSLVVGDSWHPAPSSFSRDPIRHLIIGCAIVAILILQPGAPTHLKSPSASLAITPLFPARELTRAELLQAHRETIEVEQQSQRSWMRPIQFSWPLMVLVNAFVPTPILRQDQRRLVVALILLALYALSIYFGKRKARKWQRELDALDYDSASPARS